MALEGYEHRGFMGGGNSGVEDDLYARILALGQGTERSLLISLDLCEMTIDLAETFRRNLASETRIPRENIVIYATHTHSGPVLDMNWGARELKGAARIDQISALESYIRKLQGILATLCNQALNSLFPARFYESRHLARLGFNRRCRQPGGGVRMMYSLWENPGVEPSGPYDEDIPTLSIIRDYPDAVDSYLCPAGPQRIVLLNPSFHPVVLGQDSRLVSADYPGAAIRSIEEYLGQGTKGFFVLGASGDTHPNLSTQTNPLAVKIMGQALGAGVVSSLACRRELVMDFWWTGEKEILLGKSGSGSSMHVNVAVRGEMAFVNVSAECFTIFGQNVKNASPFPLTIVGTLANGSTGYIPSSEAFGEGDYEVVNALKSDIEAGTLDTLERLTLEMLVEAHQQFLRR